MWVKRVDSGYMLSPTKQLSNASFIRDGILRLVVCGGPVCFNGWAKVGNATVYDGRYLEISVTPEPRSLLEAAEELVEAIDNTCLPANVLLKLSNLSSAIERERKRGGQ